MDIVVILCLMVLQMVGEASSQCVDLDPAACIQMSLQNSLMCQDISIATMVCPGFCGKCDGCSRDIEIMIQDSSRRAAPSIIKQYLRDMVNRMEIGQGANKIGVALYESDADEKISLSNNYTKTEMLHAIDRIRFEVDDNDIDKDDVLEFLHRKIEQRHIGDRPSFGNVFIILVDRSESHDVLGGAVFGRSIDNIAKREDTLYTKEVIVINAGITNAASPFTDVATDSNHVVHVDNIHMLASTLDKVLELICL